MSRIALVTSMLVLALYTTEGRAQWLTIGAGPAVGHGALAERHSTGVGAFASLERQRQSAGLAVRGELAVVGFRETHDSGTEDVRSLNHVATLAHLLYVFRDTEAAYLLQPYVGVGAGPAWRSVEQSGRSSGVAGLGAVSMGIRAGGSERRALLELRNQLILGGPSGGTQGRALITQLVFGVSL